MPIEHTFPDPDPLEPSPREVSLALLTRHELVPATSVNALVAAWLQWMIRDWFSHGRSPTDNPGRSRWPTTTPGPSAHADHADPTRPDPPARAQRPAAHLANTETPWWDGSQIYGTTPEQQRFARSGEHGKLRIGPDGQVPLPTDPEHNPAMVPGFWLGLTMLQTLFTLEHNAICDRLRAEYPSWSDDHLFEKARLPTRLDRQDPHDRVDTGRDQPPDDPDRAAGNWWGWPASGSTGSSGGSATRRSSAGSPA